MGNKLSDREAVEAMVSLAAGVDWHAREGNIDTGRH
jgi:hypothetical protein